MENDSVPPNISTLFHHFLLQNKQFSGTAREIIASLEGTSSTMVARSLASIVVQI